MTGQRGALAMCVFWSAAFAIGVALYAGSYVILCGRMCDFPIGRLRAYRWEWCGVVYAPAARIESSLLGREVDVAVDPDLIDHKTQ